MLKKVFFASVLFAAQLVHAAVLYDATKAVGCATVVSVRDTKQAPLYNDDYQSRYNDSRQSADLFGLVAQLTGLGIVAAAVGSIATDAVVSSQQRPIEVIEPQRGWRELKAVSLKFDDGRVVNLPMANADRFAGGHHYQKEIGERYPFSYNAELKTLLIDRHEMPLDKPQKVQDFYCGLKIDKAVADAAIASAANLVDESKIVPAE